MVEQSAGTGMGIPGPRRSADGVSYAQARELLTAGPESPKAYFRRILLQKHPERRIQVDTAPLKAIIDYSDFKCHPKSSVARGEAIRGSDIDAGVVILRSRLDLETQTERELAFVEELRRQGFDVYHPREVEEIAAVYDRASEREAYMMKKQVQRMVDHIIRFHTAIELEAMRRMNPQSLEGLIGLAGTRVE